MNATSLGNLARASRAWILTAFALASQADVVLADEPGWVGGGSIDTATSGMRVFFSLLVVLVVLAGSAWAARWLRQRQTSAGEPIEIVSGVTLGAKERVVLLRVGDEQVLVGVTPAGMRRLHVIKGHLRQPAFTLEPESPE